MSEDLPFAEWIARVRHGDADSAAELVRRYERAVRVAIRVRLVDPNLRRQFDSLDICQSVMCSFFVRAAAGQFELAEPGQLVGLLVKMAQNKLYMQVRRHGQQKRDAGRSIDWDETVAPVADPQPGPATIVAAREQLAALMNQLSHAEQAIARRRAEGQGWAEIAADLGESPQAVRMRLTRAIGRVASHLGLDDGDDLDDNP